MGNIIETCVRWSNRAKNAATILPIATLSTLGMTGCADSRTPYEAYVACDASIAAAVQPADIQSCYTSDWQPWFNAKDEEAQGWFQRLQEARPLVSRLHEEQLLDNEDESILLIVGHTRAGQPAAISVKMRREHGRWRIDHEEPIAMGATGTDAQPLTIALGPEGGPDWYPGELAARLKRGLDGRCTLWITHVFRFPELTVTSDCARFASPGTYTLEELMLAGEVQSGTVPVKFFDHRHYARQVNDGELRISSAGNGAVSGEFRFDTTSGSNELTIAGTFSNLPFDL